MKKSILIIGSVLVVGSVAMAVDIETVPVGNPGNTGELSGEDYGPGNNRERICGAVSYEYNIGKYEVTAGQYCDFLNAVAGVDTYGLHNTDMRSTYGCKIERYNGNGTSGNPYQYRVASDYANRPISHVSWYDSLRFVNWLQNGQPTGAQDSSTTEDGAYDMSLGSSVVRKPGATWVLPTEDEWYKAAYYDPDKPGGAGYWGYPTASDTAPNAEVPPGANVPNGSANYDFIDTTYYTTEVGAYTTKPSVSAYGTFDQGGNVSEWNEAEIYISGSQKRGARGGAFNGSDGGLWAGHRGLDPPESEVPHVGFRVASVPEPATLTLLALGGLAMLRRRKRGMCK